MPDELKRHLAKQLRLDHGHPDVWCPFGSPDCGERYDSKKHIIVFELWQTNCLDCMKAREAARGSYSFDARPAERCPHGNIHAPPNLVCEKCKAIEWEKIAREWHDYALKLKSIADTYTEETSASLIEPPWVGP